MLLPQEFVVSVFKTYFDGLQPLDLSRFKRNFSSAIGRIIVINLSDVSYGEQASLMNLFLSAQQMELRFHVCSLGTTNLLLRQASDITGGVHRQIEQIEYVLQFLMVFSVFDLFYSLNFRDTAWATQNRHRIFLSSEIMRRLTTRRLAFVTTLQFYWDSSAQCVSLFIVNDVKNVQRAGGRFLVSSCLDHFLFRTIFKGSGR